MNSNTHHENVLQLDAVMTPKKRRFNLSKIALALFVLSTLAFLAQPVLAGGDHAPVAKASGDSVTQTAPTDEHGEQALKLTETQQALAGISLLPLSSDSLNITNLNLDIRATAT
ncbi:MAG: RND transporter MFP subunit, partial [Shewanella sp.]|nr:RND transporter MFP subunit [Shewanella sp.]